MTESPKESILQNTLVLSVKLTKPVLGYSDETLLYVVSDFCRMVVFSLVSIFISFYFTLFLLGWVVD